MGKAIRTMPNRPLLMTSAGYPMRWKKGYPMPWGPGCYYKISRDQHVGATEWGVTDDLGKRERVIPAGTILILKGVIERLVTLGGDDGIEVTTANEYLRFIFVDPRFPGERRLLAYDMNWGSRRNWSTGSYQESDLQPNDVVTSPLIMLALVEAGLTLDSWSDTKRV